MTTQDMKLDFPTRWEFQRSSILRGLQAEADPDFEIVPESVEILDDVVVPHERNLPNEACIKVGLSMKDTTGETHTGTFIVYVIPGQAEGQITVQVETTIHGKKPKDWQ